MTIALPIRAGTVGDWVQVPGTSHAQALQGSASPRSGPEAYHGKGRQGQGLRKGITPQGGGGRVIHK